MNIEDLTIKQAKELATLFGGINSTGDICSSHIGKYHIFRTYSAGVFFGKLKMKSGNECIIDECRRLWYWKTKGGISLSEVAKTGLSSDSKVCGETSGHWIEAIEIIPCTDDSIKDIKEKLDYVA